MKKSNLISIQNFLMAFAIIFTVTCTIGCKKEGCTNPNATNYDSDADEDDGSCIITGCTDSNATNYDLNANEDNGSCIFTGCTDSNATNYDSNASEDDGSCIFTGCTNQFAENYDATANEDDGSCTLEREKFIGTYIIIEVCGSGNDGYTLTISKSSVSDNKVIINNLFNAAGSISATIDGETINIDNELDAVSGILFTGSGTLTDNKLDISFIASNAGNATTCLLEGMKQ